VSIDIRGQISDDEAAAALSLADAAAGADGVAPLSEQVRLDLRYADDRAARNLLAWRDGDLAGLAHLGSPGADGVRGGELVVHPAHRRNGLGTGLAAATVAEAGQAPLRIWAHGDLPAAARLAKAAGFVRVRALWRMLRPLSDDVPDMLPLPGGISLRTFVPGHDEATWLTLNARAFASHPEQGRWTQEDLAHRERESWFDPRGFFVAERNGQPVGFHWTKIHPPARAAAGNPSAEPAPRDQKPAGDGAPRPLGEVYVLGVDPSEQGTGLGKVLTIVGLRHLAAQGVSAVMLYVDEENTAAIRLYERFGFAHTSTDVMYQHTPPAT
jgi:mycothiol synthase